MGEVAALSMVFTQWCTSSLWRLFLHQTLFLADNFLFIFSTVAKNSCFKPQNYHPKYIRTSQTRLELPFLTWQSRGRVALTGAEEITLRLLYKRLFPFLVGLPHDKIPSSLANFRLLKLVHWRFLVEMLVRC